MSDDAVALLALDLQSKGLLPGLRTTVWKAWMTDESLKSEHWLVAYEAFEHGWLPSASGTDYIAANSAYAFLRANNVRFYDETASLANSTPAPGTGPRPTQAPAGTEAAAGQDEAAATADETAELARLISFVDVEEPYA
jgi:hypothetical protein